MRFVWKLLRYATYLLMALILGIWALIYWKDHTVTEIRLDAKYDKQEELDQLTRKAIENGINKEESQRLEFLMEEERQYMESELNKKLKEIRGSASDAR